MGKKKWSGALGSFAREEEMDWCNAMENLKEAVRLFPHGMWELEEIVPEQEIVLFSFFRKREGWASVS